jgi:hypothetical protein
MANRWIEFVRKWAAKAGISYACAVSKPECRAEYQAIYGNRKKLPRKTEREMMGQEDIRSQAVRTLEKQKKKKPALIIESDSEEETYIIPKKKKPALIIESDSEEEYIITPKKKEKKQKKSQKSVATERVSPKLKPVMDKLKMLQEDLQSQMMMKKQMTATLRSKLSKELKGVLDEKKRLVEMSRMMGEDRDVPPALKAEVQKIEKKIKKVKPLLIVESDEEEVITPAPKKKKAPASVESQKAEKGENVEIVSKHLIDEILKTQEKIADWELNNIMLVAKARVDGGFTLDDENKVKKLPRDELRSWYRKSGKKTRFDDVYSINTAPKNVILNYLFNWDSITDTDTIEDWGALKRDLDALSVAPTQKALKIPVKLNAKGREFILKEINSYLFRPQVLELTRLLGITPSKKDTKIDTAPLILQKLEEGEIDLNDVFKGIRTLEKNFHNTDAIKARQKGRYSTWKYDDESQRLLKREKEFSLKRELDFGIFDYSKNFGNPDDPTDYVKLLSNWFEKEGVGFEKKGVAPKKKTAKEIKEEEEAIRRVNFYKMLLTSFKKTNKDDLAEESIKKVESGINGFIFREEELKDARAEAGEKMMNPNAQIGEKIGWRWVFNKLNSKVNEEEREKPKKKAKKAKKDDLFATLVKASPKGKVRAGKDSDEEIESEEEED